ncbi:hypothetical protein [uncultured Dysosmobacter sp.]|uniref:hypothetical protein n=1 Tax=uncultured Dysosmobacter sp. TaxID=2591384 RepID=UPI00267194E1|nr:hypothetical protein [uncultured Dysosmobacter sp.]
MRGKIIEDYCASAQLSGTVCEVADTEVGVRLTVMAGDYKVFIFPDCQKTDSKLARLIGSDVSYKIAGYDSKYHVAVGVLSEPA